ncbi:hypothetical protein BHE74_00011242, partial [Ensete ventricosum]
CTLILAEINKKLKKPEAWKHAEPLTEAQLKKMRDEFWDTAPYYGGKKEVSSIYSLHFSFFRSAETDTSNCISGAKYELPKFVLSEPSNLIRDN